jgi:hypothetical protein
MLSRRWPAACRTRSSPSKFRVATRWRCPPRWLSSAVRVRRARDCDAGPEDLGECSSRSMSPDSRLVVGRPLCGPLDADLRAPGPRHRRRHRELRRRRLGERSGHRRVMAAGGLWKAFWWTASTRRCVSSAPRRASGGRPHPSPTTTGAVTGLAAVPPSSSCRSGGRPADGESSGWSSSYLPVVRRARVGLLPSRSGRIAMYAAAINRPSPATRSPEGARRSRADGVLACELGRCLPARPRHSPSTSCPPRASSSPMPFRNRRPARPEPGQPGRQETAVIARGDRRGERTGGSCEVQGSCGVPTAGVSGPCTAPGWVHRSAGRPGVRSIKAQGGIKDKAGDRRRRLTASSTWVPEAESPSRAGDA